MTGRGKSLLLVLALAMPVAFAAPAFSQDTGGSPAQNPGSGAATGETLVDEKLLQGCFKCHGEGGISRIPTHPTIAGQKPGYLAKQLRAFRESAMALNENRPVDENLRAPAIANGSTDPASATGDDRRRDFIMSHMAQELDDGAIDRLARHLSQLSCAPKGGEPDTEEKPRAPEAVSRCVMCHGENGVSSSQGIPNLAGQQRAYLRRELLLLRESAWGTKTPGEGTSRFHPIMEKEVARLRIEEVDDLSSYFARLDCRG